MASLLLVFYDALARTIYCSLYIMVSVAREDKLNADNRSVVNNFETGLAQQVSSLCETVTSSISQQNKHLQGVEKLCHSFLQSHDKVF